MADADTLAQIRAYFDEVPHARECGVVVEHLGADGVRLCLPFREDWLGDPERGLIHTAVVSFLIDNAAGVAALAALPGPGRVATLDLRVDYLRPALRDLPLHCEARCLRRTRQIAFVQSEVWQGERAQPVASSQATFMCSSASRPGAAA